MSNSQKLIFRFVMLGLLTGLSYSFYGQSDSSARKTKKIKEPKHFFSNTIFFDQYSKPSVNLKDTSRIGKQLGSYGVSQTCISFYSPILTINKYNKDSTVNSNFHLLLSGTAYYLKPVFSGISQHTLAKYGLGIRAIYNTGKKSIFFIESTPFLTQDITPGAAQNGTWRMSGTMLWSYSPNNHFNFRLGATKSFMWGNRFYLPFIGFRFGRVDGFNFSAQFPKNISLNMPLGNKFRLAFYTKPQGGVFNFSNKDTVYNNEYYKRADTTLEKTIHFGRYELLTGLRFDVVPVRWLNFYVAAGFSTKNGISFYSNNFNKNNKNGSYGDFYARSAKSTLYFNFGITVRLGKTKSYYNNKNMYEAIDLNNKVDVGNNISPGNGNIVIPSKKIPINLKPSEVQDLIDANDF